LPNQQCTEWWFWSDWQTGGSDAGVDVILTSFKIEIVKLTGIGPISLGTLTVDASQQAASASQFNVPKQFQFMGQPAGTNRLMLQYRIQNSGSAWSTLSVPPALGGFAVDWSGWARGIYDFKYAALDAAGNVLNSESGAMTLSDTQPVSIYQNKQSIGGPGRAFLDNDGLINVLEQGSNGASAVIRFRASGGSWGTAYTLNPAAIGGSVTKGWFKFDPATYGVPTNTPYDYYIEVKDGANGTGTTTNKVIGSFTRGVATLVTTLTNYQGDGVSASGKPQTSPLSNGSVSVSGGVVTQTMTTEDNVEPPNYAWGQTPRLTLPNLSAVYGAGQIKVVVTVSGPAPSTNTYWYANNQTNITLPQVQVELEAYLGEFGYGPTIRLSNSIAVAVYFTPTSQPDISIATFNSVCPVGYPPHSSVVTNFAVPKFINFTGQPLASANDTTRLILQYRVNGSNGNWTTVDVPHKGSDKTAFTFDWSGLSPTTYEFQYTTVNQTGAVLNSQKGTVNLSANPPSVSATTPQLIGGSGRTFMAANGVINVLEQGATASSALIHFRIPGGAWGTGYSLSPATFGGAGINGWFQFNPADYSLALNTNYEYMLEAKAGATQINKVLGSFTRNVATLSLLTNYQDQPGMVHFSSQPASAATMQLTYRVNGGSPQTGTVVKIDTGAFDWDATSVTPDRYQNYSVTYEYSTFDSNGVLVNKAYGTLQLGAAPQMQSHTNDFAPTILTFNPPQSNATQFKFYYRNHGSTGVYALQTLTRTDTSQPFAWNIGVSSGVDFDYYYEMLDANNLPVVDQNGTNVQVAGRLTANSTNTPSTEVQIVLTGTASSTQIKRTQSHNAFGEIAQEVDGLGRATDLTYNALGLLIKKEQPLTSVMGTNGVATPSRPTTEYTYDLSGRLIAVKDANLNLSTLSLLAQSGNDGEALTTRAFNAGNFGSKTIAYDVFGNARVLTDELSRATLQDYDANNRLIKVTHPERVLGNASTASVDQYVYDQVGNRIKHINANQETEKTYYDSLGRVTGTASFEQVYTGYQYDYFATINGVGGVQVGGYRKVTTRADGLSATDKVDYFNHTTEHTDYGNRFFAYGYNWAGWLATQSGGQAGQQNISYTYYNNGYLKNITDNATHEVSEYRYDVEGNRTFEGYSLQITGQATQYYQQSTVDYDELNRVTRIYDPFADIHYAYDANGNRMHVWSYYNDGVGGNPQLQDYWYKYDALNRFTVTMGILSGGAVVATNASGIAIEYDNASQRTAATYGSDHHRESYTYSRDGYLESTSSDPNSLDAPLATPARLRAVRVNDALGRVTRYMEYATNGTTVTLTRLSEYSKDSNLVDQKEWDEAEGVANSWDSHTVFNYGVSKAEPLRTAIMQSGGNSGTTVTTTYTYEWWDEAKQKEIQSTAVNVNAPGWASGYSHFDYDLNGHLKQVSDSAGKRSISYTTDAQGLILVRNEMANGIVNASTGAVNGGTVSRNHVFYYFNGHTVGDVGNDGPLKISYAEQLAQEKSVGGKDRYKDWQPISSADFDQNYQPINADFATTGSAYTVRDGDNLQSIAAALWGDNTLWYLIADANGLSGREILKAGQTLVIPNKVTNIHNNSGTFAVYDAGKAMGDVNPTLPEPPPPPPPPRKKRGCGLIGQILVAIVTVVVAIYAPQMLPMIEGYGALTVAASAAIGSLAGQAVGVAIGVQDKISWSAVAMAAIGGGVTAGVGNYSSLFSSGALGAVQQAAVSSVISQGIGVATGLQEKFSWTAVAASAVGAGVGYKMNDYIGGMQYGSEWGSQGLKTTFGNEVFRNTLSSMANGGVQSVITGQRPNWGAIAAQSFGQSLGGELSNQIIRMDGNKGQARLDEQRSQSTINGFSDEDAQRWGAEAIAASDAYLQADADAAINAWRSNVPKLNVASDKRIDISAEAQDIRFTRDLMVANQEWGSLITGPADVNSLFPGTQQQSPLATGNIYSIDGNGWAGIGKRYANSISFGAAFPTSMTAADENGLLGKIRSIYGGNDTVQNSADIDAYDGTSLFGSDLSHGGLYNLSELSAAALGVVQLGLSVPKLINAIKSFGLGDGAIGISASRATNSAPELVEGAYSLVGANRAVIDPRKLTDYALNIDHPVGGNKAQVFESVLGFKKSNADDLLTQLRQGVINNTPTIGKVDQYGARFTVDIPVVGPINSGTVRTGWIYKADTNIPELTTLFVKK
jgi:YD repeat-containing protein